jgi:hypothetical protein
MVRPHPCGTRRNVAHEPVRKTRARAAEAARAACLDRYSSLLMSYTRAKKRLSAHYGGGRTGSGVRLTGPMLKPDTLK